MIDYILLLLKEDREDWNENYGILKDIHAICILHGRLLYYEPSFGFGGYDVIQNNDLSNVELEEVLDLNKQLESFCCKKSPNQEIGIRRFSEYRTFEGSEWYQILADQKAPLAAPPLLNTLPDF